MLQLPWLNRLGGCHSDPALRRRVAVQAVLREGAHQALVLLRVFPARQMAGTSHCRPAGAPAGMVCSCTACRASRMCQQPPTAASSLPHRRCSQCAVSAQQWWCTGTPCAACCSMNLSMCRCGISASAGQRAQRQAVNGGSVGGIDTRQHNQAGDGLSRSSWGLTPGGARPGSGRTCFAIQVELRAGWHAELPGMPHLRPQCAASWVRQLEPHASHSPSQPACLRLLCHLPGMPCAAMMPRVRLRPSRTSRMRRCTTGSWK